MDALFSPLLELLPTYGPWLLFVLAILETCFVTGLVVPSGLATSAATVLALEGRLELVPVALAAVAGGAVGDTIGFWIGRRSGEAVFAEDGRFAKALAPKRDRIEALFGRHPFISVTVARLISFVRTVMPMTAGMSGLPYRTYIGYELVGVVAWGAMYVGIGIGARESWEVATQVVGVAGTALFAAIVFAVLLVMRRRTGRATAGGE